MFLKTKKKYYKYIYKKYIKNICSDLLFIIDSTHDFSIKWSHLA